LQSAFLFFFIAKQAKECLMEYLITIFVIFILYQFVEYTNRPKRTKKQYYESSDDPIFDEIGWDLPESLYTPPAPIEWELANANMFMSRVEKQKYMLTEDWANLKEMCMLLADHQCEVEGCECTTNLHLHHVDYIMLGTGSKELPYVRIVCGFHHQLIHDKLGYDRTTKFPLECLK